MKKIYLVILILIYAINLQAQYATTIEVTNLNNNVLTSKINNTLSGLVTEFNKACSQNRPLNLTGYNLDVKARQSIEMLWKNSPFRCEETDIVEKGLKLYGKNEYEVRNIPFIFEKMSSSEQYHEVAITFDVYGKISSFHITLSQNQMVTGGAMVSDLRRRQIILDYVEQYRTAYNLKDINFLNQVFADDALIVVGNVKKEWRDGRYVEKVVYTKQTKPQYINNLRSLFARNSKINITFDDIKIFVHPNPNKSDWYGVLLKQNFSASSGYSDEGYLSLLWDFTLGDDQPQIHLRVWQPTQYVNEPTVDDIFENINIY